MTFRLHDHRFLIAALVVVVGAYYADRWFRRGSNEINAHDPNVNRISTFELQPGEVGVTVRVRRGEEPVRGAVVWAEQLGDDDEDAAEEQYRRGQTNSAGLARVPIPKGGLGETRLFVRDANGCVGGGTLSSDRLLSAPDVLLAAVAPRSGRLVTSAGQPIASATLTALWFSTDRPQAEGQPFVINIPDPVKPEYTVQTDAAGRFSLPGVPVGFACQVEFSTKGFGQGNLWLPAEWSGECRLAPAGAVRVRVAGDGTAAQVQRLRCHLSSPPILTRSQGELAIEGNRSLRHDGNEELLITNVVPGAYWFSIEGKARNPVLPDRRVMVTVVPGVTAEATVPLKRAGRVEGRVVDGATGEGLNGVRLNAFLGAHGEDGASYGGRFTTDGAGRFAAYVPAGVPTAITPERCPRGYASAQPLANLLLTNTNAVTVAAGETRSFPDIKLYRRGTLSGLVTADGQPAPGAVVEMRWDAARQHKPATVTTDAAGRFQVAGTPPAQPAAIRIRAAGMVNATISWRAEELVGPLTIPISAANAFRIRGHVSDNRGRPVERAKVVVTSLIRPRPEQLQGQGARAEEAKASVLESIPLSFEPAEVEALFTDKDGDFESGALWPTCVYLVNVSADGHASRQLPEIEGKAGQVHEVRSIVLTGMSASVVGTVVGTDGRPVEGATVINAGDGPQRLTASTDGSGRFALTGLYDGPVLLVSHKPGFRWGYVVVRPGEPEPRLVLRSLAEPPSQVPAISDEQRKAEAALIRHLLAIVEKAQASNPAPTVRNDPWVEARKGLEAYLARQTREDGLSGAYNLVGLARELAKTDRATALRVLREAAASVKRLSLPVPPVTTIFQPRMDDQTATLKVHGLIHVAQAATELDMKTEAGGWLAEAEALAWRLPETQRRDPLAALASAWIRHDPARTEKLLAALGSAEPFYFDLAVAGVIRQLKAAPEKAVPWLDRFKRADDNVAQSCRSELAIQLAERNPATAVTLGEGIRHPGYRAVTLARLATVVSPTNPRLAHELIDKAAAALAAEPKRQEHADGERLGMAVYLLWQAKTVAYPDLPSLVALTMTTRQPVPAHGRQRETWRWQTLRLAVGVSSVDPAAGRALLGSDFTEDLSHGESGSGTRHTWLAALALADPATATRHLKDDTLSSTAASLLAVLQTRSNVVRHFNLLNLPWLRGGDDSLPDDDD